jgi:hypothetical protein
VEMWSLYELPIWATGILVVVVLLVALESGNQIGNRKRNAGQESQDSEGGDVALTSMLALLGLMLAFTYAFTLSRADARKQAVLDEANAIGTAFLRADLAPEPTRTELRKLLREYAQTRLPAHEGEVTKDEFARRIAHSLQVQSQIWPATARMVKDGYSGPIAASIIQSVNEVIDIHGKRLAVIRDRLPGIVLATLLLIAAASLLITGFSLGKQGRMIRWRFCILVLVLAAVITVITDFDRGDSGFVKVNKQSLVDLIRDMDTELSKK